MRRTRSHLAQEQGEAALSAIQATQLLGSWNRIAGAHVALSAGCSCGVGISNLRVQDFEQDILEFLRGRHAMARTVGSIAELLAGIARDGARSAEPLLADLARSLESFEVQHSGR